MYQTPVPNTALSIVIEGNTLRLLLDGHVKQEHTATYNNDTPWYSGLEEFAVWCGDGFRAGAVNLDGGDRIIYLYDHRPSFLPKIKDAKPEKQSGLEAEQKDEPGLFSADGGCEEWGAGANFGYAWNLDVDYFSEWGYAPFPLAGEDVEAMNERITSGINSFMEAVGGIDFVIHPIGQEITAATYRD